MPWFIDIDTTMVAVVKIEVSPPCPALSPPIEYYKDNDVMYAYGRWTRFGLDIPDQYWPISARMKTGRESIPSLIMICMFWGVSQSFRDCVELFEPNIHEFRKVDIFRKDGTGYGQNFYAVNIKTIVNDAVIWDQTTSLSMEVNGKRRLQAVLGMQAYRVTMHQSKVDGKHFFVSHDVARGGIVVSDELFEQLSSKKLLTGIQSLRIDLA